MWSSQTRDWTCVPHNGRRLLNHGTHQGMSSNVINGNKRWVSFQSLSRLRLFATPWTAARQASLSITSTWSLPKLMSIESVMPSNHLILCCPLLLPPSVFPSIRVFSKEPALCITWLKYWSFSIRPSCEYSGLISWIKDVYMIIQKKKKFCKIATQSRFSSWLVGFFLIIDR